MRNRLLCGLGAFLIGAGTSDAATFKPVQCEGTYKLHLQGICTSEESIFWCFTSDLVKTDTEGKIQNRVQVPGHHGDLCYHDGKVYVAAFLRAADRAETEAISWVYVYDATDLRLITRYPVVEAIHRAGGIAYHDGRFIIVGGSPKDAEENHVFEYDSNFAFIKRHVLKSGYTNLGIQTATFADGHWWFGCYGKPGVLLKSDVEFHKVERFDFECSVGICAISQRRFLVARGGAVKDVGYTGRLFIAQADSRRGLVTSNADLQSNDPLR